MTEPFAKDRRYDSTQQAWEAIWDAASVEAELQTMTYPRARRTLAAYARHLPRGVPLLEAGSGLSAQLIVLREMGFDVIGLDYAVNALLESRAYDSTLPLAGGDVHALPYADGSLGAYLSFGVLEHFEHGMGPALAEAWRVLRPGGVLVLTIPYPSLVNRYVAWRRRRAGVTVLNDDDFYESTYTREELEQIVRAAGFTVVESVPTSHDYTLWGVHPWFRAPGYYRTSRLAEWAGRLCAVFLRWPMNFETLVIARK
jgi:SAM-dependent methyltransferase